MIAFLRGRLVSVQAGVVVLEVGGVGYRLQAPLSLLHRLPPTGEEVLIYTHLVVREDSIQLFGFLEEEELMIFIKFLSVAGVGSKGALSVLSIYSSDEIKQAIFHEDIDALTRVPGIGKKIASRIVLELKEKIACVSTDKVSAYGEKGERDDAIAALEALGYTRREASEVVEQVQSGIKEPLPAADLVKKALRIFLKT
ncbi:MAG: Holliday junction branch migration protein RuvA [Peptococcaceae bacterium]|nr:MAG: Holliday junction branch migration protein RuvA [Peptococcaceae bacterium]